jgi:hypothetical protein
VHTTRGRFLSKYIVSASRKDHPTDERLYHGHDVRSSHSDGKRTVGGGHHGHARGFPMKIAINFDL